MIYSIQDQEEKIFVHMQQKYSALASLQIVEMCVGEGRTVQLPDYLNSNFFHNRNVDRAKRNPWLLKLH